MHFKTCTCGNRKWNKFVPLHSCLTSELLSSKVGCFDICEPLCNSNNSDYLPLQACGWPTPLPPTWSCRPASVRSGTFAPVARPSNRLARGIAPSAASASSRGSITACSSDIASGIAITDISVCFYFICGFRSVIVLISTPSFSGSIWMRSIGIWCQSSCFPWYRWSPMTFPGFNCIYSFGALISQLCYWQLYCYYTMPTWFFTAKQLTKTISKETSTTWDSNKTYWKSSETTGENAWFGPLPAPSFHMTVSTGTLPRLGS